MKIPDECHERPAVMCWKCGKRTKDKLKLGMCRSCCRKPKTTREYRRTRDDREQQDRHVRSISREQAEAWLFGKADPDEYRLGRK